MRLVLAKFDPRGLQAGGVQEFEGRGGCFGNVRQVARSMTSQHLETLGQALNCRLSRGLGKVRFFYHAMAAKSQLCDKSLWVRDCYNYYLRLSSASFKAFDRLALLGDWQAFHEPPSASLSTTGGGEGRGGEGRGGEGELNLLPVQFSLAFLGFLWAFMGFHGFSWVSMGFHGLSWVFMGFLPLLWAFIGFHGL